MHAESLLSDGAWRYARVRYLCLMSKDRALARRRECVRWPRFIGSRVLFGRALYPSSSSKLTTRPEASQERSCFQRLRRPAPAQIIRSDISSVFHHTGQFAQLSPRSLYRACDNGCFSRTHVIGNDTTVASQTSPKDRPAFARLAELKSLGAYLAPHVAPATPNRLKLACAGRPKIANSRHPLPS
jgi:hypothetical protein